jgi:hypothetical protein
MKKIMLVALLTLSTLPAFAQRRYPYPQPCQVAAIDNYNRLIARFYGQLDPRYGQCRDALRNCNMEIRRRGWWDARCVQLRGW